MKITRRGLLKQGALAAASLKARSLCGTGTPAGFVNPLQATPSPASATLAVASQGEHDNGFNGNRVVAIDRFGRAFNAISSYKPNKQVGLFFWLWIGQPYATDIYDATKIMSMPNGIKLLYDLASLDKKISPNGQAHFWGEPLWGYYNSDDEWVMHRQILMLTQAGVDFIVFDATNAVTYKSAYTKLLGIIDNYIRQGWNPPRVAFYTHSRSTQTTKQLYQELYEPQLYPTTWYRVDGKPFIIAYTHLEDDLAEAKLRKDASYSPTPLPQSILEYFHFRKPQWPFDPYYAEGFPWIEWTYPQPVHENMMSVTVASHPNVPMSRSITQGVVNWGRGWDPAQQKNVHENVDKGTFFQSQWDHALDVNPDTIFVGGWNEWIAYKQPWGGEYMLCDAADKEFSRDIEPMRGGYQDSFYIQLIQNIRKYKGLSDPEPPAESKTIKIAAGAGQWENVCNVYRNFGPQNLERDAFGAAKTIRYSQPAPRNNLQEIKVTHDAENVYFYIRCESRITEPEGSENWMNVFIGTGDPQLRGWEGYEYVIGRKYKKGKASIGRVHNDFSASNAGHAEYDLNENILQIAVPRKTIGLIGKIGKLYFKVADGVNKPSDIMDYYVSGSSMPLGRLSYLYSV